MSSRLVETMMINVEDFSESFLTCGTCLSGYDSAAHSAKLLPCSHTVCRTCLERILETQADEETMRCPICRETILVPRGSGGVATFPPAFIVNQLLDLMASQRRDRVPKCRRHPNQELLFCETCDVIFCPDCRGGSTRGHATEACSGVDAGGTGVGSGAALSHNVISFSVAIKRCSEILLYKASLCVQELNGAQEAVSAELQRLAESSEACVAAAESSFAEIRALVERRQAEVTQSIRRISEEKRHALEDQLALIESERSLVREQCDRLNSLIDVRSISKGISYLNDKLDTIASLTEPRENAFLRYHDNPPSPPLSPPPLQQSVSVESSAPTSAPRTPPQPGSAGFVDIARCLAAFGRIAVSTTYPPLCTAKLPEELHLHLLAKVMVRAYDYHGEPQTAGTDPINVRFEDAQGRDAPACLVDHGDGTYEVSLCGLNPGAHSLVVQILSRPIRGSPFSLHVLGRQKPRWSIVDGPDGRGLVQPFAVTVMPSRRLQTSATTTNIAATTATTTPPDDGVSVLLLDTGNSRLLVADAATGRVKSVVAGNEALRGQAATGMALGQRGLWVVNWRVNELMLLDLQSNEIVDRISSSKFVEPTSVCICPRTGRVLIADNGAGCVFAYHDGEVHSLIGGGSVSCSSDTGAVGAQNSARGVRKFASTDRFINDALRRITGICVMTSGEIVLAAGSELRIYSSDGAHIGSLYAPMSGGGCAGGVSFQSQMPLSLTTGQANDIDPDVCLTSTITQNSLSQRTASCGGRSGGVGGLSSAPGSTLTLDTTIAHRSLLRPPSIGGSMRPTTSVAGGSGVGCHSPVPTATLRGHFGGVSGACTATDLGECLLASHTDRSRSAIIVYPEVAWRGAISDPSSRIPASGETAATNEGEPKLGVGAEELGVSLMRQARRQAYTLEVEPGLRRLAGLAALPDTSSFLVAVDLGGQSAHCLRFV